MAKIYLSATYQDLKPHRDAVYRILRRLRHDVISMEDYVATDTCPLHKCLSDVAASDIHVGLLGWRYGYVPERDNPGNRSITDLEAAETRLEEALVKGGDTAAIKSEILDLKRELRAGGRLKPGDTYALPAKKRVFMDNMEYYTPN